MSVQQIETPLHIRPATEQDIPALENLIAQSVRVLGAQDYSDHQLESALHYLMGVDEQVIADGTYYVVEAGNQIVGSGGWSRRRAMHGKGQALHDHAEPLLNPASDAAKVRMMFVHPDWARRGIGYRLLQVAENAARQADFKRLELMATLTGQPLYLRFGFHVVENVEYTLPDGVRFPGARMEKSIG
jgi:N-acetylglutamate synthase-like GNAT family acetyltransferase